MAIVKRQVHDTGDDYLHLLACVQYSLDWMDTHRSKTLWPMTFIFETMDTHKVLYIPIKFI